MSRLGKQYIAPIMIIAIGTGWMLNANDIVPGVDWVWTFGLAVAGFLTLAAGGLDKLTGVVGPFLVASSVCALLRQLDALSAEKEVPILITVIGVLMLVVHLAGVREPRIFQEIGHTKQAE